jgi:Uma2 family endonuclease
MIDVKLMTAEELLVRQPPHMRSELVDGVMRVREPGAYRHGKYASRVAALLDAWVRPRKLGDVVGAETGFILRRNPDSVRAPDAAFISAERLPPPDVTGYAELAPDLVVEVRSRGDRAGEIREKTAAWLDAGVRLVWHLDPERRRGAVHRADGTVRRVDADGAFDGEAVLPGFVMTLEEALD